MSLAIRLGALAALLTINAASEAQTGAVQQAELYPSDPTTTAEFGIAVDLDGDHAVVGTRRGASPTQTGGAYVFARDNGTWTQTAKLLPGGLSPGAEFGTAVAIDGDRLVVGAFRNGPSGLADRGSAYVYVRDNGTWTPDAALDPGGLAADDFYGYSVAIDGDRVAVGASDADNEAEDAGAVYLFTRSGTSWTLEATLTADDAAAVDRFGDSVSLRGDRLVVGAPAADIGTRENAGAVYVFERSGSGWTQTTKLTGGSTGGGVSRSLFGSPVRLDGDRLLVGASRERPGTPGLAAGGAAYVFDYDGTEWARSARIIAPDPIGLDRFGARLDLDGDRALFGMYDREVDGAAAAGLAYLFTRDASGTWAVADTLTATDASADGDRFGIFVALDGDQAIVGAYQDDDQSRAGSAYVFTGLPDGGAGATAAGVSAPEAGRLSAPFPNPTAGAAHLTLRRDAPRPVRAVLLDALGRTVRTVHNGPASVTLTLTVDASGLPAGVYAVRVTDGAGVSVRRLTVVR